MNRRQKNYLNKYFNMYRWHDKNGKYLSLESWTENNINMYIELDATRKDVIAAMQEWIDAFDPYRELQLYARDSEYRSDSFLRGAFSLRNDVIDDFKKWANWVQGIINELKEMEKRD